MNTRLVCYFILMISVHWHHGVATHTSFLLGDTNSKSRCCRGDHYEGLSHFHQQTDSNQRPDHNPSFTKHRHEYHTHPTHHHQYYDDDYYYRPNKHNYFDYRSPPTKYSYHKEYYTRKYNNPPYQEIKYMQKRKGFIFPDTHSNGNDGRGGYRPHIPNSYFQDHRYHENKNDFSNFRNNNDHRGFHDQPYDKHRQKYRPGLLGVSLGRIGAVVVTGPDGYKHVIHNLPPWTDTTPDREHYQWSVPGNMDAQGGLERPGSHSFSTGLHKSPQVYDHQNNRHQTYKKIPIYFESSDKKNHPQFLTVYKESPKSHLTKPPEDTPNSQHGTDERLEQNYTTPPKQDKFHPSLPFYKYSEADPLYHPNRSPLQTYSPTEVTQPLTTLPSNTSTISKPHQSEKPLKYPDSINVQLPPPAPDSNTRVPYVAATEVTERIPNQHLTVATQASEATHEKSLIQILPTKPSVSSPTESEIPSSTLQTQTTTVEENMTFSPTSLIQDTSMHPGPADNSIKTEHFLPTIITEKSDITPHQSTEQSNSITILPTSAQEFLNATHKSDTTETSVTNNTNNTENKIYTAALYVTAVTPPQSSNNPDRSTVVSDSGITNTETTTEINTVTNAAGTETIYNSTKTEVKENSNITETIKSENEEMQPTVETDKTEVTKTGMMETSLNESNLHIESIATKPEPLMINQLQTLVSHAQSLNYLHHNSNTTAVPTDESDR
ncbi:uncharacterized protein LOC110830958 [Zootermopsis nevadensis]|uniref:uncharacterized protein LOC110830958 n=1 Tax=Zootermopsis nevadensis TaxID=136037 RepID=UPI000B8E52BC|nr:uncharacterized protein LOC110830958 [Zootermopsis nevadensis]